MNKIFKIAYRLVQIVSVTVWSFSSIMFVVSILSIVEYSSGYDFSFIEILSNDTNDLAKAHLFGSVDIKVNTILTVGGVILLWMFIFYYSYFLYLLLRILKNIKGIKLLKTFSLYNIIPSIIGCIVIVYNLIVNGVYKSKSDILSFSAMHLLIFVFSFVIYYKLSLKQEEKLSY
ncbi:MAG: hypothetical protein HRT66_12290 [Flavobacteriaceae bacterium]|nr:hypothetical protein [Flavobacteriaceae bacterium]